VGFLIVCYSESEISMRLAGRAPGAGWAFDRGGARRGFRFGQHILDAVAYRAEQRAKGQEALAGSGAGVARGFVGHYV
jgi:hypothetical protein